MSIQLRTDLGTVELTTEVIATVVGGAVTDNYGVVGMASKNQLKDNWNEILKKDNYSRGVVIHTEDDRVSIDIYIFVNYGTKISEICRNVQAKVQYDLKQLLGISVDAVNVYVQGVRVVKD